MVKDWYLELRKDRGYQPFTGQNALTYYLRGVGGIDRDKHCRAYLHFSNPNCDLTLDRVEDEPAYAKCCDYQIAFDPAVLDLSGRTSFANQVKAITDKAEQLISQKQSTGYLDFSVPGATAGMLSCRPAGDQFTLESETMGYIQNAPSYNSYVPITSVDIKVLANDVKKYLAYEADCQLQQQKDQYNKDFTSNEILQKLDGHTPKDMVKILNAILRRQELSVRDLTEILAEDANANGFMNIANTFYDAVYTTDALITTDKVPAYDALNKAFEAATYDNGKPLTGYNDPDDPNKWHDYFEHYDRDQDYWEMFMEDRVVKVIYSARSSDIKLCLDCSSNDILRWVEDEYGGADYDHDF